jgi:D-xylulose reductase
MKALVLEQTKTLSLRDISIGESLGPNDVRIAIKKVGICGSDIHYYLHGAIGHFVVREPMVLGHEAAGEVIEVGRDVRNLVVGDRVCMEPGVPNPQSRASRLGMYNLDPEVKFWATPPVHGCLRESVVHPASYTYKLPENVSYGEGALVEPLAIGLHAATKAAIKPGDTAVVLGCGTIGIVTALSVLAGGVGRVIISDVKQEKLDLAAGLGAITAVNIENEDLLEVVRDITDGWGADIVLEASGSRGALSSVFDLVCPGGHVVIIGMPVQPVLLDIAAAQSKEARVGTIFRYANMYPRAMALLGSRKVELERLITGTFSFEHSIEAFEFAAEMRPESVKVQIESV